MSSNGRRPFFRIVASAAVALGLAALLAPAASAQGLFSQPKYAAIVVDANSGEVLYAKRADAPRYPASITKVMTLYMTFEALQAGRLQPNEMIGISPHAASQAPSRLGLRPGQGLTVDQAIKAVSVKSANDIAVALAERVGGSEGHFADLMTAKARQLGMAHTRFANASGLPDPRQISSARDIAILSRAVLRDYPQYYGYFSQRTFEFNGQSIPNHNHLLLRMPGVDGLKTGYTVAAGFNLAASAVRDGRRLITVVLGGSSTAARDENVETLLSAGFEVLHRRSLGQNITVASIADTEDNGALQRPPVEQGDGDQQGMKVELADASRDDGNDVVGSRVVAAAMRADATGCTGYRDVRVRVKGRHGHMKTAIRRIEVCNGKPGRTVSSTVARAAPADPCLKLRGARHRTCERKHEASVAKATPKKRHHRAKVSEG